MTLQEFENHPSAFAAHLGLQRKDWSEGFARLEMPVAAHLANRTGLPHGGAYATMLDTAMGHAGCWVPEGQPPKTALTLSMTVQFLSRPLGQLLIAEGRLTGGGKRTFFAEAKVFDETGEQIASGTGVFRYRGAAPS